MNIPLNDDEFSQILIEVAVHYAAMAMNRAQAFGRVAKRDVVLSDALELVAAAKPSDRMHRIMDAVERLRLRSTREMRFELACEAAHRLEREYGLPAEEPGPETFEECE